ncbi:MAG: 6-phosphogluconolactonase [Ktedonobacteraceae bacterium]|nr:6-phosphogluconolactonase [Ktedonobacteraceae bacterium]
MKNIRIFADSDTLSHTAARYIVQIANEAIVGHGRFTFALSGGSTPRKLYGLLASEPYRSQVNWQLAEIFWSDERNVPPDDTESNYHMAYEVMLSKLPIPAGQVHRMPAELADRDAAAHAYELEIKRTFGTDGLPGFDLIQLGMGPEGHTASLFPHQAALREQTHLILPVEVPKPPPARLTFTPPLLNAAHHILFLVTGQEKDEAVQAVLEGPYMPDEYPAQIVRPANGDVLWMLDEAAASKLKNRT